MRGKKTSKEDEKLIMSLYMISTDYADIARQTGKAESTVKSVIERCKDLPEYVEVRQKMKILFSDDFLRIVKKALKRLEDTIDSPESNIMVHHLTTVIGTLIDKLRLIHDVDAADDDADSGVIQISQVEELTPPEVDNG